MNNPWYPVLAWIGPPGGDHHTAQPPRSRPRQLRSLYCTVGTLSRHAVLRGGLPLRIPLRELLPAGVHSSPMHLPRAALPVTILPLNAAPCIGHRPILIRSEHNPPRPSLVIRVVQP